MSLAALFPVEDFRFHLTLRRAEPRDFFAPREPDGSLLGQRARWLDSDPSTYAAAQPESEQAVREFAATASEWMPELREGGFAALSPPELVERLGKTLEPDVLFLSSDADGQVRAPCRPRCAFPTGWALNEKLGPYKFTSSTGVGARA